MTSIFALFALSCCAISMHPSPEIPKTIRLWDGPAPGALGTEDVDVPTLTYYPADPAKATGAAFVVCPGGGYQNLAAHEAGPPAEWLNSLGISAFVLKYRLGPRYHNPAMKNDVLRAIRMVRSHASDWKIDPERIGILGFSAGGHISAMAATCFDGGDPNAADPVDKVSSRPNAAVLIYPVITMKDPFTHAGSRANLLGDKPTEAAIDEMSLETRVTAQTPPSFLITTDEDGAVPMENSIGYVMACRKNHVSVELHMYAHGPHGFGMGGNDPVLSQWPKECANWLRTLKFASTN